MQADPKGIFSLTAAAAAFMETNAAAGTPFFAVVSHHGLAQSIPDKRDELLGALREWSGAVGAKLPSKPDANAPRGAGDKGDRKAAEKAGEAGANWSQNRKPIHRGHGARPRYRPPENGAGSAILPPENAKSTGSGATSQRGCARNSSPKSGVT